MEITGFAQKALKKILENNKFGWTGMRIFYAGEVNGDPSFQMIMVKEASEGDHVENYEGFNLYYEKEVVEALQTASMDYVAEGFSIVIGAGKTCGSH
ncbi:iron-sulfur cluster biosynthesis family protein [Sediminitomix flava]|uniref:Fe-S cluster assembly iron-binding protein IscA n=1 Tax=Sediminitomix flava TaxID=379075 RepID=A0A315ZGX9_SEDFL|nr:iron-sulfur cluster biosynthesis family protein [Sediminitomix flava]PWJ44108.1 Fe-S cluster assembly iron-binding protein IscA [Sediminitomix flava]